MNLKLKRSLKSIIYSLRLSAERKQSTARLISFAVILQAIKTLTKLLNGLRKSRLINTRGKL